MYKKGMKKINFAVSDFEYQRLHFLKTVLGLRTDAGCFRFCLNYSFREFKENTINCSDLKRADFDKPNLPRSVFTLSHYPLREELISFRNELNSLLGFVKK